MARISFHHFSKMFGVAALVVCLAGLASLWASHQAANAQDQSNNSVVGVWEVKVDGAPFKPHLFTFHSDGTFLSANPDAATLIPAILTVKAPGRRNSRGMETLLRAYSRSTTPAADLTHLIRLPGPSPAH